MVEISKWTFLTVGAIGRKSTMNYRNVNAFHSNVTYAGSDFLCCNNTAGRIANMQRNDDHYPSGKSDFSVLW